MDIRSGASGLTWRDARVWCLLFLFPFFEINVLNGLSWRDGCFLFIFPFLKLFFSHSSVHAFGVRLQLSVSMKRFQLVACLHEMIFLKLKSRRSFPAT